MSDKLQKLEYHASEKRKSIAVLVGLQLLDLFSLFFVAVVITFETPALIAARTAGMLYECASA